MPRFCFALMFTAALWAQDPATLFNKPPADVDKALRERVGQFYQYHVTREFRKAEALVADDTKDFFYNGNKPAFLDYEIRNIEYSDNFTKAKVMTYCNMFFAVPGFADKPIQTPIPSTWKVENGQWFWYVDMKRLAETPFGTMKPGPMPAPGQKISDLPGMPAAIPTSPEAFLNKVKADRLAVTLKAGGADKVTLTNTAPGAMFLSVAGKPAGIDATLDVTTVKADGSAVLTLKAGQGAEAGAVRIRIEPSGENMEIRVSLQ